MPCRINRRRQWTQRIILESLCHGESSFVTLTYEDANIPLLPSGLATLDPKHLVDWLKRLRIALEPVRVRYFGVGEYGDLSWRPHYHVALFGYPPCLRGSSVFNRAGHCCEPCDQLLKTWGLGFVHSGSLTVESAQYIAGYTTKKLTRADDDRLEGRTPEFARMSRMPGLGREAMWEVADAWMKHSLNEKLLDVPTVLAHGKRKLPLGRYLRRELRSMIGRDKKAPDEAIAEAQAELQPLRQAAEAISAQAPYGHRAEAFKSNFGALIDERFAGRHARMEGRQRLFRKRGSL